MQTIIDYFSTIPSAHRTVLLVGALMLFWVIEGIVPLTHMRYAKFRHLLPNLFFTLTTAIINFAFALVIVWASDSALEYGFGLMQWVDMPIVIQLIVGLLLLDLIGAYFAHWVEHKVHWMWRFHIIHHSDSNVDSSTALRHHPGESVIRAAFTLLAVAVVGAPIWMVLLYQSLSALMSQFNHANISIGKSLDNALSYLIVTPGMHRVHHHITVPLTDTNYGNIFSIWDRIFGTFAKVPASELVLGLDVFDKREGHLGDLLGLPFNNHSYKNKEE